MADQVSYVQHNGELNSLYTSKSIKRIVKMKNTQTWHVARLRKTRNTYHKTFQSRIRRDHLGYLDLKRSIILKKILRKYDRGFGLDSSGSWLGQVTIRKLPVAQRKKNFCSHISKTLMSIFSFIIPMTPSDHQENLDQKTKLARKTDAGLRSLF